MSSKISHSGIIESVEDGHIRVRILQASACGSCAVSRHCHASEAKEKTIDVYPASNTQHPTPNMQWKKGDAVTVVASTQTGVRAIILGFGIPFLLLLAVLFTTMGLTGNEPVAALAAVFSLLPYYILLYMFRDKVKEKLTFWIE
ncbi:MAG: SoxR reducing system RseC family protein [Prevotella sp.]|nr:SoxR reducing system RseC family protein [Prevotella sp.]MBQ6209634.1 SoxR reducing system RseC family protein [Prevotella sp.]